MWLYDEMFQTVSSGSVYQLTQLGNLVSGLSLQVLQLQLAGGTFVMISINSQISGYSASINANNTTAHSTEKIQQISVNYFQRQIANRGMK